MNLTNKENELLEMVSKMLAEGGVSHYIPHTRRVLEYCHSIGKVELCDLRILNAAAILHDVGRCKDNDLHGHVKEGLVIARELLERFEYTEDEISKILYAIEVHHSDLPTYLPRTIEGRVLLDADRIEIVGEYGMARWLIAFDSATSPEKACQLWLDLSLRTPKGGKTFFCTKTGYKFGRKGFKFCKEYCETVIKHVQK